MSNNNNRIIVFASILGAILATGLLALNPLPTIKNAGAQIYEDRYGYDNNDHKTKKSSDVNIQKIKCVNSNINVNGIDITQIPQDGTATAAANEGTADAEAANTQQNGNGLGDRLNVERNLVNVCVNLNDNEQLKVEPPEPATLTVNKEIFGCDNIVDELGTLNMVCDDMQNTSPDWLPCIGSTISNTPFCQRLPANLFDIEVLDDKNNQIQQFEGSFQGTTIQNIQPDTFTVNEIKVPNITPTPVDQLYETSAQVACVGLGFDGGGELLRNPNSADETNYTICFQYQDEQGNDCSTVTLAAGEEKTCTVKNYILTSFTQTTNT